jgi:hypothetical protein
MCSPVILTARPCCHFNYERPLFWLLNGTGSGSGSECCSMSRDVMIMTEPGLHVRTTVLLGFEVLTPVVINSSIFWGTTPCGSLQVNRCFGEAVLSALLVYCRIVYIRHHMKCSSVAWTVLCEFSLSVLKRVYCICFILWISLYCLAYWKCNNQFKKSPENGMFQISG